jgi:hypothetical protein
MTQDNNENPNLEATPQPPDNPNAGDAKTPEVSKEQAPSTDDPKATPMATASKPDKEATHDQSGDKKEQQKSPEKKPAAKTKPAGEKKPAAKKEKPPKPEDKPFPEFIEEEFTPALETAFTEQGVEDMELKFAKEKLPAALGQDDECWQVIGNWQNGQRQFNIYFLEEDIKGQKAFSYATDGSAPSTIESFMIDERRVNLDLLVLYTLQRLNGQKWLARN